MLRDNISIYTVTEENGDPEANPRVEEVQYFENIVETVVQDARMNYTAAMAGVVPNPTNQLTQNIVVGRRLWRVG